MNATTRTLLFLAAALLAAFGVAAEQATRPLKIGVIGAGHIGGTIGALWVKAGHEVMFSALDIEQARKLAASLGPRAQAGTPREAAAFGDVVLIAVPYKALPQIGRDYAAELKGKVVLDTADPLLSRDGDMAYEARLKGTGVTSAAYLPGVRLVRAFNTVDYNSLHSQAHRAGERVAIPLAADDADAVKTAVRLVEDAGFEPVVVGPLARAKLFDPDSSIYNRALTAREVRELLGLTPINKSEASQRR